MRTRPPRRRPLRGLCRRFQNISRRRGARPHFPWLRNTSDRALKYICLIPLHPNGAHFTNEHITYSKASPSARGAGGSGTCGTSHPTAHAPRPSALRGQAHDPHTAPARHRAPRRLLPPFVPLPSPPPLPLHSGVAGPPVGGPWVVSGVWWTAAPGRGDNDGGGDGGGDNGGDNGGGDDGGVEDGGGGGRGEAGGRVAGVEMGRDGVVVEVDDAAAMAAAGGWRRLPVMPDKKLTAYHRRWPPEGRGPGRPCGLPGPT